MNEGMKDTSILTPKTRRRKPKESKISASEIAEIVEGFWVKTSRFEPGDDPESAPPETNWDFLSRRGSVTLKKEKKNG